MSFGAFGSKAVVAVTEPASLGTACSLVASHLRAVDLACSRFRPDSELMRVNARGGSPVSVSSLFVRSLRVALRAARMSDGLVDPTVGKQLREAGYDRTFSLVRARGSWNVRASATRQQWEDVELDEARGIVRVPAGVELDLGATAKALAADDAARLIVSSLGCGALVSLGGDIAVDGPAPYDGWPVRIADDHAASLAGPGPVVAVAAGGLATSSSTVRRWATNLGELHHLIDPRTGRPADSPWRTVSVAAATCVDANVAATAALVVGADALRWLSERGLPARAVRHDGSVSTVAEWPADGVAA